MLIVDDEALVRWSLRERFLQHGYAVLESGTAATAIAEFMRCAVDVVLLDCRLPDSDGIAVLRVMKTLSPQARVILMTAFPTLVEIERLDQIIPRTILGSLRSVRRDTSGEVELLGTAMIESAGARCSGRLPCRRHHHAYVTRDMGATRTALHSSTSLSRPTHLRSRRSKLG